MRSEAPVIDADGHILEPPDLWEKYLDAKYRANAIRLKVDDEGYEYLEVAGKPVGQTQRGQLGTLGGMGREIDEATKRRRQFVEAGKRAEVRLEKPRPEGTYVDGAALGPLATKARLSPRHREAPA